MQMHGPCYVETHVIHTIASMPHTAVCTGGHMAGLPFAKDFQEVLPSPFVKWPRPSGIPPLLVHLNRGHVPCNHPAVHDQEAHNC